MRRLVAAAVLCLSLAPLAADEPRRLDGHTGGVRVLRFSPDGQELYSGGFDGSVRIWNVRERRTTRVLMPGGEVRALAVSPDGKLLVAATSLGVVRLWLARSGTERKKLQVSPGRTPRIMGLGFLADGGSLGIGLDDGTVKLFDVAEGRLIRSLSDPGRTSLSTFAVAPEPDAPIVGTPAQKLLLLNAESGVVVETMDVPEDFPTALACAARGGKVAAAAGMAIRVYQPGHALPSVSFLGHGGTVEAIDFSQDGRWMATCSRDRTVRVWDTAGGDSLWRELLPGQGTPLSVALSPEATWLAAGDTAGKILVWKLAGALPEK